MMQVKQGLYAHQTFNIVVPLGICFGSRDFLGSEGSDELVRQNKYFSTGESQIFKIDNSDHNTYTDNPD